MLFAFAISVAVAVGVVAHQVLYIQCNLASGLVDRQAPVSAGKTCATSNRWKDLPTLRRAAPRRASDKLGEHLRIATEIRQTVKGLGRTAMQTHSDSVGNHRLNSAFGRQVC